MVDALKIYSSFLPYFFNMTFINNEDIAFFCYFSEPKKYILNDTTISKNFLYQNR